jgi:hypothetical protein
VDEADRPDQHDQEPDGADEPVEVRDQGREEGRQLSRTPASGPDAAAKRLFRFVQFEFPWALGPPAGRYVLREPGRSEADHVLVVATLGAPERRRLARARRARTVAPEPQPTPVTTGRATVIEAEPVALADAERWLAGAGVAAAEAALRPLTRAVRSYRLASGDPTIREPGLAQVLVVRAGFGAGEEVAEGRWSEARELPATSEKRERRASMLRPQERLAALLGGRTGTLACEELALRARHDLDGGHPREAALQLRVALDAALAELPATASAASLRERIEELEGQRDAVHAAADAAIAGLLPEADREAVAHALGRLEAALRARAMSES